MRITLIIPKIGRQPDGPFKEKAVMEPLALAIIASLTPADVDIVMHDDRIEDIPYDEPTDLVAITVETFTAKRAYEISYEYRKRGVPVIMGGFHPSLLPDEVKHYADSVYIGDAEDRWPQVVADAQAGKLQPVYHAQVGQAQPKLIPRRDIFKGKSYLPITLLQFSRGCSFACTFCASSIFFHKRHYYRPVEEVVAEIEAQDRKLILFVDDCMLLNRKAAKALFRALIPLKIRWLSEASIDMAHDKELMGLMAKSGCLGHLVGFESIDVNSLKSMRKTPNLVKFDHYLPQLEVTRDYGIQIWAAFTIGHEYDTKETIKQTLEFTLKNKFTLADYNVLVPYPSTPLYEKLARENRLLYDGRWWLHPDYRFGDAAFQPKRMSPKELAELSFEARLKFYSFSSMVRRAFDFKTNMRSLYHLGIYQLCNSLSRNDGIKKQGIMLGDVGNDSYARSIGKGLSSATSNR